MKKIQKSIVVIGAGHAGVEAALAASRIGIYVYLITMDSNAVGRMSCNPAIGGLAKGHLVKEIDILGGIMSSAADYSGIQFKILNKSKGRAVWSSRAQVDKKLYSSYVNNKIKSDPNIEIVQDEVVDFSVDNSGVSSSILASSRIIKTRAIVVCSGTFLNGLIHIGEKSFSAGRFAEKPSLGLTHNIVNKGHITSRLKTGTPPRIASGSVNWSLAEASYGDNEPEPFSFFSTSKFSPPNTPCFIVNTNPSTHKILSSNINKSPMYSGKIEAAGPRYCPSVEDKVVRFSARNSHQLFLEPEWTNSNQIYVNGFSTSMPQNVQERALKKIPALKNCKFIRPGYAIEYDYFPSHQLKATLESKIIPGLYFAGQLNGTSGYEEAAAQGLMAGANAALKLLKKKPLLLKRNQAYIGVLIDDLITKDINEPYRMFTSSAEHRLSLRNDNAALRVGKAAFSSGLISQKQHKSILNFSNSIKNIKSYCLSNTLLKNNMKMKISDYLLRPKNSLFETSTPSFLKNNFSKKELFTAETDIKYQGYVKIELARLKKIQKAEVRQIPPHTAYAKINGLSAESVDKLSKIKPETLGQASRIAGVRPADIGILAIHLKLIN